MNATPDSTFTNPEQLIADLQRQLVECKAERDEAQRKLNETTTERDEALARGAATAEVLRVINSSPGELAPVFEAVLQSAVRICEANFGTLYLRETDAFRAVAMHNAPPAYAEARTRALLQPPPDAPLGRVAITKQVAHMGSLHESALSVRLLGRSMNGLRAGMSAAPLDGCRSGGGRRHLSDVPRAGISP
jgi:hypothetical protein